MQTVSLVEKRLEPEAGSAIARISPMLEDSERIRMARTGLARRLAARRGRGEA